MQVLGGKYYLINREKDDSMFVTRNYGLFLKGLWNEHSRKIIKGMGITSKHYKDRSMLTREEGGTAPDEPDTDD